MPRKILSFPSTYAVVVDKTPQGDLMQLLLIQTQVMKVDMESALMQMDQIMRANRLNFSIMVG